MNTASLTVTIALALAATPGLAQPPQAHGHAAPATQAAAVPAPKLQAALRSLWHGHVVHTRDYALAAKAGDEAAAARAAAAVVDNAKAIADAVAGFYGAAAGEQMLGLLAGHWGGVQALTDARMAGDEAGVQQAMADLVANGGQIAAFLAGANPNLPEPAVRGLLVTHVGHHAAQVQQIEAGDLAAEAKTWQAMQAHMDVVADALAAAIAQQFPDQAA